MDQVWNGSWMDLRGGVSWPGLPNKVEEESRLKKRNMQMGSLPTELLT
ncbi:hypothetical protein COLO4_16467 [Corchorus olitorius]|uniref:Uncharacterized protein n=1 Tax=Corchorus olitorius TaxID=93759 RepID=A0A1R3JHC2_9ROSI|nr:hypothetical protein COLO4_16467 [Corchorus olitorius]